MKRAHRVSVFAIIICLILLIISCQKKEETEKIVEQVINNTADESLVLHMPFDGTVSDSSMFTHHVEARNVRFTEDRFGKKESAARFDGRTSWISIEADSLLDFHDRASFTVTSWVNVNRFSIDWSILRKKGDPVQYYFGYEDDRVVLSLDREESRVYSQTTLFEDTWYFVVGVYDADLMQLTIYVNSLQDAQAPVLNLFKSKTGNLEIGRTSTNTPVYYLNGVLDDIRVYSRKLSEKEIRDLYHEGGWNL